MKPRFNAASTAIVGGTLAIGSLLAAAPAHAVSVGFESFSSGDQINQVVFGDGTIADVTTVSNRSTSNGGTNQAVAFDTNNFTGNDNDLQSQFSRASNPSDTEDLGIVAIISGPENSNRPSDSNSALPDDDARGGTITFTFNRLVEVLSFDYIDTESGGNELLVTAFDLNDVEIGNSGNLVAGNGLFDTFSTPFLGVKSLRFAFGGSGALDNISITEDPFQNVPTVPVPAALPLLLGGLGVFGLMGWRRKRRAL